MINFKYKIPGSETPMQFEAVTAMAKPARRLNGWQRIGIVVSVLWAIGISIAVLGNASRIDWYAYDKCNEAHGYKSHNNSNCKLESYLEKDPPAFFINLSLSVFIPVLLGWIFTYAAIGALRWIAAGFRR